MTSETVQGFQSMPPTLPQILDTNIARDVELPFCR